MASLSTLFLAYFLTPLVAANCVTQDTLTVVKTVTATRTITLTAQTEPVIPPAVWSTDFVPKLPTDYVTRSTTDTISGTITRTRTGPWLSSVHYACSTIGDSIACSSVPLASASPALTCSYSTWTTEIPVVSTRTVTESVCTSADQPLSVASIPIPTYACDPQVNWSCFLSSFWSPHASSTSLHHAGSTVHPIGITTYSNSACAETSYFLTLPSATSSSAKTALSNSPHGQSSSGRFSSGISHTSFSGGYYPTASSSVSPVTAGSSTLKPSLGIQTLVASLLLLSVVGSGCA